MCRHLAYLGPSTTLSGLILEPRHGLLRQSHAPRDMRGGGTVNADGFGVGWYPAPAAPREESHIPDVTRDEGGFPRAAGPVRYRSEKPIWSDPAFAAVAGVTCSTAVLAAVRSATVGMPVHAGAAAPFGSGPWLFSHNGLIRGWPVSVADLAGRLPVTELLTLDAPTDAALVWALVRERLRAGDDPADAVASTVRAVEAAAPGSRLNLLLTDGTTIWASTWTHALSVRVTSDAALVASEPLDDLPGWTAVPDRHLVVATPGFCQQDPL